MVTTLEIIERSIYDALLQAAIKLGVTLNPQDYQPITTPANIAKFNQDKSELQKYVYIFGSSNSESKGQLVTPRIIVNTETILPGGLGLPPTAYDKKLTSYQVIENPSKTIDQVIDIRLCAGNSSDLRLLIKILQLSLPIRGYIKPYNETTLKPDGNIYLEVINGFDDSDNQQGILEKVFQYQVQDSLFEDSFKTNEDNEIPMISDIELILNDKNFNYLIKQ